MKEKFKSYTFWVALCSAIIILVQSVAELFGVQVKTTLLENIIMSVCGVLVVLGIVTKDTSKTKTEDTVNIQTEGQDKHENKN